MARGGANRPALPVVASGRVSVCDSRVFRFMRRLEHNWLSRRIRRRAALHWNAILASLQHDDRPLRDSTRDEALGLHAVLGRLLHRSEAAMTAARGSLARMVLPAGTDWRWRPQVLQARIDHRSLVAPQSGAWLSPEVSLYHDCPDRALILRQRRNRRTTDLTDYALVLEVLGFRGSYLSYSLGLPPEAVSDLAGYHIIRLDALIEAERPITLYARLNIQQGPNTETMLRKMGDDVQGKGGRRVIEFDLGYAELSARKVDKAWIDLILEAPAMNAVTLRDIVLSRHPRAQM